jgi:hypothetical protein
MDRQFDVLAVVDALPDVPLGVPYATTYYAKATTTKTTTTTKAKNPSPREGFSTVTATVIDGRSRPAMKLAEWVVHAGEPARPGLFSIHHPRSWEFRAVPPYSEFVPRRRN